MTIQYASILIVEDDPIASALLAGWARHLELRVTSVDSIAGADAALGSGSFDLILSDVHLPGNQRLAWVERLLAGDFPPPLILITGNPELETTLRAANLPVAGYLVKPPDLAALTRLARRLVIEHRHRRELRELSRDIACLVVETGETEGPLQDKLQQLSRCLSAESRRHARSVVRQHDDLVWRDMMADTISTLEKTKDSFRSRELGQLRQRLQQFLASGVAA